ncbi:YciI family protein [Agrococcus jejuensis]|uniref:Uncharacterized conserved protein n=1 Tax=Agrococcus jejuensis TaxID=399736 RepID=A0A1G8BGZ0_9MICO|nr:YciI family protein [Agrococcus jejuensis]SDH32283.1 Uncharacterized conserved protein [Agrococcus jejuensis]
MQFMLIMRDDDAAAIERRDGDVQTMMAAMGAYNDRLEAAGALVTAVGLDAPSRGAVVHFGGVPPMVTDGPYGEIKELFNGFWIVEAADLAAATALAADAPLAAGMHLEVRRIHGDADLPA